MKRLAAAFIVLALPALSWAAVSPVIKFEDKAESMKKAGVGAVVFPHAAHEKLNKCDECHPAIFKDKRGANTGISMKANMEGKYCGSASCHNGLNAFPLYECARCHEKIQK